MGEGPGSPKQKRLSKRDAQKKALELWESGWVWKRRHASHRAGERQAEDADILNVLKKGKMEKEPVWDKEHEKWEYVVRGFDVDGEPLAVVFSFEEEFTELFIITVKGW